MSTLTPNDFVITNTNNRLAFSLLRAASINNSVSQNSLKTRMLIIFEVGVKKSNKKPLKILSALKPVWQLGWEVSMAENGGQATDFASSPLQLMRMWRTSHAQSRDPNTILTSLKDFVGRRVVLFVTKSQKPFALPSSSFAQAVIDCPAELFVINGGVWSGATQVGSGSYGNAPIRPPNVAIEGAEGTPNPISPNSSTVKQRHFNSEPGPFHASWQDVDLHDAVTNAISAAGSYYCLRITDPPSDTSALTGVLKIMVKVPQRVMVSAKADSLDKTSRIEIHPSLE
ncbi:MAG: hypothetical protein ABSA39_18710 [Edaphobacter sp.]